MVERRHRKRRKWKKKWQKGLVFAGFLFICALVLAGAANLFFYWSVSGYPKQEIYDNIYIGKTDVSNMTAKEAKTALEKQLEADRSQKVVLEIDGQRAETTLEQYALSYKDLDRLIDAAMDHGKKGSLFRRFLAIRELSGEKKIIKPQFVIDRTSGEAVLKEHAEPLTSQAQNASITKTGIGFSIQEGVKGETVDTDVSLSQIEKTVNQNWDHRSFSIVPELKEEEPAIKAKDLESIRDELGSFSTNAGGGERWKNLKTGVDHINGTILMPGQTVSVHDITAPYDAEHGYVPAGSYENGQVVDTYGGGICQVSSTLYNAVLYAELEVVKRQPHSMLVAYVPPSRDAAIAGDVKDFVFKNNYDTPVFIHGEIDGANQLRFVIYGKDTRQEGRTVDYETEIVQTEEPGVVYKVDKEAALGSMKTKTGAREGKTVRLWKIVKQDGKEVSRDVINNSTYRKTDKVILVGTKADLAEASQMVEEAVKSQNPDQIRQAVAQAQALPTQPQPPAQGNNPGGE